MNERLQRWDERYARGDETFGFRPSPPLPLAMEGLAPGLALDVACGAGRHALYLAERGWRVVAVDGSRVGVELMRGEARRRGVEERIEAHVADLGEAGFAVEPGRFDLVCVFYYLDRALFPALRAGVRPGGRLVAAIHVEAAHRFLLAPGELRTLAPGPDWEILHAHEGPAAEGGHAHATAELVARRLT